MAAIGTLLRFFLSWLARAVLFAAFFAYISLGTIASFASPDFYTEALLEEGVYDRVYDEVLVDPALRTTQEHLMGGIQVPAEEIVDVVRRVIPPSYLRQETERTIAAVLSYFRKETETLEMNVNLEAPLANAAKELTGYLEARIEAVEVVSAEAEDLEELTLEVFRDVEAGRLPSRVPSFQHVPVAERLEA